MKIFKQKKHKIIAQLFKFLSIAVIVLFVVTMHVSACDPNKDPNCQPDPNPASNSGVVINTGIKNPLGNSGIDNIPKLIKAILDFVVIIGIPLLTLAIIYTGFLFVLAQGNKEKLNKAKQAFLYVIIGGALILGSFVIAGAIKTTVDKVVDTNV